MDFAKLLPAELEGRTLSQRVGIILRWVGDALDRPMDSASIVAAHALVTSALVVLYDKPAYRKDLSELLASLEKAVSIPPKEVPQG